ncbi:MAG: ATP-binding protein [Endozoicomonadaceae bacterium]|nr:ATP-binding protein [Endozoicomonadaceae bacterium]
MSIIDGVLKQINYAKRQHLYTYSDLDHNCSDKVIVTERGALLSLIKLKGLQAIPGDENWRVTAKFLLEGLKSMFKSEGVSLQWVYEKNDAQTLPELKKITAACVNSMKSLKLDVGDILVENIKVNQEFVCHEESYIAIWTDSKLIEKSLFKTRMADLAKKASSLELILSEAPNVFGVINEMIVKHESIIADFTYYLTQAKMNAERLNVHDGIFVSRKQFDHKTPVKWRPTLVGDKRRLVTTTDGKEDKDGSQFFWKRLNQQLGGQGFENIKSGVVKINDVFFKSGSVLDFPLTLKPFRQFISSIDKNVPFRISFKIHSGRGSDWTARSALNGITAFLHSDNKQVAKEMAYLDEYKEIDPVLRLSCSYSSWGNSIEEAEYNYARLDQSVQSWGVMNTTEDRSDEVEMLMDTVLGFNRETPAVQTYAPLSDIVKILPHDRTGRVWERGFALFRTLQDVVFPWLPVSPITNPSIELYIARSRQGKSVLSNSIAAALTLGPNVKEIPYICTIDVGPSSIGIYNLLRDRLPEDQKSKVVTYMLSLEGKDYINPFQRSVCMEVLFSYERSTVSGLLMLMAQDSKGECHRNMEGFIDALIDEVYDSMRGNEARDYSKRSAPEVQKWMEESNFELSEAKWFEVEEALADAGEWKLASLCSIYASPILKDFIVTANNSSALERQYGSKDPDADTAIKEFVTRMTEASRKYPVLTSFSTVDFKESRLRSIDLQNVISKDEIMGPRQNGIMYNLALYLGSGDFFLNKDCLNAVPTKYKDYYREKVKLIRSIPCRLFMDEFHQASGLKQTVANVERYMREGGKWGINSALASQEDADFTPTMIAQATSYFFLGGVSKKIAAARQSMFSLTDTDVKVLTDNTVHGPKRGGSSLLYVYKTSSGQFSQVLKFPVGSQLLWANSTTPVDLNIKEELSNKIGSKQMLKLLSKRYPSGTIADEVMLRQEKDELDDNPNDDITLDIKSTTTKKNLSYVEQITNELMRDYYQQRSQRST